MRVVWLIFVVMALGSNLAFANQPVAGNWFNPSEDGRGWIIEKQNDVISVTHFVYDEDGNSTFYINAGLWNSSSNSVESELYSFGAGQCIGCIYRAPSVEVIGIAKVEFSSSTRGKVRYPDGTTIEIQKMAYGYESPLHVLQSAWATSWYGVTAGFHHAMFFDRIDRTSTTPMVVGSKVFEQHGKVVVGGYTNGVYIVIVDASTSFYDYYYALIDGETLHGVACTARKTSPAPSISSCKGVLFGSRTHTYSEALRLFGGKDAQQKSDEQESADASDRSRLSASESIKRMPISKDINLNISMDDALDVEFEMEQLRLSLFDLKGAD